MSGHGVLTPFHSAEAVNNPDRLRCSENVKRTIVNGKSFTHLGLTCHVSQYRELCIKRIDIWSNPYNYINLPFIIYYMTTGLIPHLKLFIYIHFSRDGNGNLTQGSQVNSLKEYVPLPLLYKIFTTQFVVSQKISQKTKVPESCFDYLQWHLRLFS